MACDVGIDILEECFEPDFVAGRLFWKPRPRRHFGSQGGHTHFNRRFAGTEALSTLEPSGFCSGSVTLMDQRHKMPRSRVIWAMAHGSWPVLDIGHRNGMLNDDRLMNLREQTISQGNAFARPDHRNQGRIGVNLVESGRFKAQISFGGKRSLLGTFDTAEEAQAVRDAKARELHGEFARITDPAGRDTGAAS